MKHYLEYIPVVAPWTVISAVFVYVIAFMRNRITKLEDRKVDKETWNIVEEKLEKKLCDLEECQRDQSVMVAEIRTDLRWLKKFVKKNGGVK